MLNFGHFWAPPSPLTFHNVKNHGGGQEKPRHETKQQRNTLGAGQTMWSAGDTFTKTWLVPVKVWRCLGVMVRCLGVQVFQVFQVSGLMTFFGMMEGGPKMAKI